MRVKSYLLIVSIQLIALVALGQKAQPEPDQGTLMAGIAKIDITPSIPVKLYGYSSRKNYSEGIHDPLSARVVIFENNRKRFVLVSSDLGSFGREVFPVVQQNICDRFKLEKSELFLSVVHSHSSPVLALKAEKGDPNNVEYTRILMDKLNTVISEAFENMIPVTTGLGTGSSPVGANRREMKPDGSIALGRNPYGITDKEVLVMKITTPEGIPVGALFDYATHATSLGPSNLEVSGDVLGLSAQFAEKILGKEVISPVFAGASGNIDPWYRVLPGFNNEPGWIPEPVLLGTLLGEEVVHVFRDIKDVVPGGEINTSFETLECPGRKRADNKNEQSQPEKVPVNIIAASIGRDVAFVGFSLEMFTEIGMEIKKASPFKYTFVITHCNGYSGYIAPAEHYKEGGYEINTSPFEIGSADMVVRKALRMLYDLQEQ